MSTKKHYPTLELRDSIPVEVSENLLHKIRYLCKEFPALEWSGILFYEVKGDFHSRTKLPKIKLLDMLHMDVGKPGHTKFDWGVDLVDFIMDTTEETGKDASYWRTGIIHSHNTMGVFFSPEDWDELHDNVDKHTVYLSFIVNNALNFEAKAVYLAKPGYTNYHTKTIEGDDTTVSILIEAEPTMIIRKLDFNTKQKPIIISDKFKERVIEIAKISKERLQKEEAEKVKHTQYTQKGNEVVKYNKNDWSKADPLGESHKGKEADWKRSNDPMTYRTGFTPGYTKAEILTCVILRLGFLKPNDKVSEALRDFERTEMLEETLLEAIRDNIDEWYIKVFDPEAKEEPDVRLDIYKQAAQIINCYSDIPTFKSIAAIVETVEDVVFSRVVVHDLNDIN